MAGDYSRLRFDPGLDLSAVFMQQGRVQLDADWNELMDLLGRRLRADTTDIIGRCTVPKETPQGFQVGLASGTLSIGRGRAYVHGLLAENHGKAPLEFDPVLAEQRGTGLLTYAEQPYFPNATTDAPLPTGGGPHLVYLDVWQREVTHLERPELIEKAVGVDTTTRAQTVWQVRVLPNVGAGVTCASPDDQIPGWLDIVRPSAGRLTTAAVGIAGPTDPCVIPPTGGYRGLENQLYRVEIHDGGPRGTATFKWSRDNATVATTVIAISPPDALTVAQTKRDSVLRFNPGDWVEITDDWLEFAQKPGMIRQVKDVNDATQSITLEPLTPPEKLADFLAHFPIDAQGKTNPQRHTRIRRWEQRGEVRYTNGNLVVDLEGPSSTGVIPVPAPGTPIVLEHGVQITFGLEPINGQFRVGDYWAFAARTADASVEQLQNAPPRGIHHHYCRLALVTFPGTVTDCRTLWPPEFGAASCECSVCVTAESHNNGTLTIQFAIDQVKASGGTVCLGPGIYNLGETPVRIDGAQSVRVRGHGWRTVVSYAGRGPAIIVGNSLGVTLEEMTLLTAAAADDLQPAVALRNSAGLTMQRCFLLRLGAGERGSPAIGLGGVLIGTTIRENVMFAPIGVGRGVVLAVAPAAAAPYPAPVLTAALLVENNALFCSQRGISLDGLSLHVLETRLAGNFINDCAQGGIVALGWVTPRSNLNVHGNELHVSGPGIVVGTDGARISANEISPLRAGRSAAGVLLMAGLDRGGINHCQVLGNRITGVAGDGISIQIALRSAMIKNNVIDGVGGGIVMSENSRADSLCIENNQLLNIAPQANDPQRAVVGIRVVHAQRAEVASNSLVGVGRAAAQALSRAGIQLISSVAARITDNEMIDIGPAGEFLQLAAGIECLGTFDHFEVLNNRVRRSQKPPAGPAPGQWSAVRIRAPQPKLPILRLGNFLIAAAASGIFTFAGNWLALLPRGREGVGLNGNWLDAYGDAPAVFVRISGTFAFNNNQCLLASQKQPVADVQAGTLIVSANHLQGSRDIEALVAAVPDGRFTVLGNITAAPINVNGPLQAPWLPLNVITP